MISKEISAQVSSSETLKKELRAIKSSMGRESSKKEKNLYRLGLGIRQYELSSYAEGERNLLKVIEGDGLLKDYAYYYLGLIYEKQNQKTKAEDNFSKVNLKEVNSHLQQLTSLSLARLRFTHRNWKRSYRNLVRLERRMRGNDEYPEVLSLLIQLSARKGDKRRSCIWARRLYRKYPNHFLAKDWSGGTSQIKTSSGHGCSVRLSDHKERVLRLQRVGHLEKAQQEIDLIQKNYGDEYKSDLLRVESLQKKGSPEESLRVLLSHYDSKKNNSTYLNKLAQSASRVGDFDLAVSTYDQIYKMNPKKRRGRESLYRAALTSYQYGDYDGAVQRFDRFLRVYPRSSLVHRTHWYVAWMNYLRGRYKRAGEQFANIIKRKKKSPRYWRSYSQDQLNYWLAMSLYRQRSFDQALGLLKKMVNGGLQNYYAIAAQERLEEIVQKVSGGEPKIKLSFNQVERSLASIDPEPKVLNQYKKKTQNFFLRGTMMKKMGLNNWAKWDFYEVEKRSKDKKVFQALMAHYHEMGAFHRSSYIGQVYFQAELKKEKATRRNVLWNYSYPKVYLREVERASSEHKVDEDLIWAIMRAESRYRPRVVSPVGARGLMQVMPQTGQRVAQLMGVSFSPEDLFQPRKGVYLGARYLRRLSDQLKTVPLVAAAYNAGPHRVVSWVHHFGEDLDLDEFIEHIPFTETRNYVKKVVRNYHVYSALEKSSAELKLVQGLDFSSGGQAPIRENWN